MGGEEHEEGERGGVGGERADGAAGAVWEEAADEGGGYREERHAY